jgi:hypothetical protein
MIWLYAALHSLLVTTRTRVRQAHKESGSVTLEQVVIALGLLVLAGVAVAAITAAVNSRVGQIK